MGKPWYRAKPDLYEEVRKEVEDAYPELWFVEDGTQVVLHGWYPIYEGPKVWDRYRIEVVLPKDSPSGLPTVYEVGNRIPHNVDRHMEPDGKACVVLPDSFWYEHPQGMTLREFLDGPLCNFLANQSLIEQGRSDVWDNGEWAHGADGILQFYADVTGTKNPVNILKYLKLLERKEVKGHWPCPCGSGEKLRKCHQTMVYALRLKIPVEVAAMSVKRLQEAIAGALSQNKTPT